MGDKKITLRLPEKTYEALEKKCCKYGLTLNALIIFILLKKFHIF
nr:MAG TPA: antitoxin [Caudoviricetes sp.]